MNGYFDPVTLKGTLKIKYINGAYGLFPVGSLETAIGTFAVRDSRDNAWLETLVAGEYPGTFEISELSLYTYRAFGEARTSIKAEIASYQLEGYEDEVEEDVHYGHDPLEDEDDIPESFTRPSADTKTADEPETADDGNAQVDLLTDYAGYDWQYGDDYRIDSTIGRVKILECQKALRDLGYTFDPPRQIWSLTEGGEA